MGILNRFTNAWNAFRSKSTNEYDLGIRVGAGSSVNPSRNTTSFQSGKSFAGTVFNRIAMDVAQVDLLHVKTDKESGNETTMDSPLQECLSVEANIDQNANDFMQDLVYSMFDEGVVAVVPVITSGNITTNESYDIYSMRVGKITQWFPKHVEVDLYNEDRGLRERLVLPKASVAIIENPLYAVTNGSNSTMKRLLSKMMLLDKQDTELSGGEINMLVHLPYSIKTELSKQKADQRLTDIKNQMNDKDNKYGIAYMDSTEKVTQLNRSLNETLPGQIAELKQELYNQLGLTAAIFDGTATEQQLRIYYSRSIDPILQRIKAEFKRKFLTKTARTQGQDFNYRRDLFKLVPAEQLAQLADTLTRNAVLSPNEVRGIIGYAASKQAESDQLINRNIADRNQISTYAPTTEIVEEGA